MKYEDYKALRMKSLRFRLLYGFRRQMLRFWMFWDRNGWGIVLVLLAFLIILWVSQTEQ